MAPPLAGAQRQAGTESWTRARGALPRLPGSSHAHGAWTTHQGPTVSGSEGGDFLFLIPDSCQDRLICWIFWVQDLGPMSFQGPINMAESPKETVTSSNVCKERFEI